MLLGISRRSRAVTAKKCIKKPDACAKLLFCFINRFCFTFSLPSPSSLLKLPNSTPSNNTDIYVLLSQGETEENDREELAAGDWISVSVEIERWNLLVCQLSDLQALAGFIDNLATQSSKGKQSVDNNGSLRVSVVGEVCFC